MECSLFHITQASLGFASQLVKNQSLSCLQASENSQALSCQEVSEDSQPYSYQEVSVNRQPLSRREVSKDREPFRCREVSEHSELDSYQEVLKDNQPLSRQEESEDSQPLKCQKVSRDNQPLISSKSCRSITEPRGVSRFLKGPMQWSFTIPMVNANYHANQSSNFIFLLPNYLVTVFVSSPVN